MSTTTVRPPLPAVAALATACSLWGASFLFAKLAFAELAVSHVVLYRFALAALVLLPLAWHRNGLPDQQDLPLFAVTGFLNVPVTFQLQFGGLALTTVSSASIIVGAAPPLLALAAVLFDGERLSGTEWMAIGGSTLGVAVMVGLPGAGHHWIGDLLVFLSILASIGWILLSKRLMERYPPLVVTAYILSFGTLAQTPVALWLDGPPSVVLSWNVWGAILALGFLCTVLTFSLWNWGLRRLEASRAGVFVNLEPLVGALLGVLVLKDPLGTGTLLGGVLILGSAWVVSRREERHECRADATKRQ